MFNSKTHTQKYVRQGNGKIRSKTLKTDTVFPIFVVLLLLLFKLQSPKQEHAGNAEASCLGTLGRTHVRSYMSNTPCSLLNYLTNGSTSFLLISGNTAFVMVIIKLTAHTKSSEESGALSHHQATLGGDTISYFPKMLRLLSTGVSLLFVFLP